MSGPQGSGGSTLRAVALALLLQACGDDCGGYSSFTDENGLIVFVACDGTILVDTAALNSARPATSAAEHGQP